MCGQVESGLVIFSFAFRKFDRWPKARMHIYISKVLGKRTMESEALSDLHLKQSGRSGIKVLIDTKSRTVCPNST